MAAANTLLDLQKTIESAWENRDAVSFETK